jgi:cytochrome c oxidase subunit 2
MLLWIAFAQMGTWAKIKYRGNLPEGEPIAHVWASQFDWRMQYPGADGVFGTWDDIESPHLFKVPADEDLVFILHSRDVLHSFFVPQFRLKQDAVPGMAIPMWFNATKNGTYDLICAELCGWGHYKMAGRVEVVSRDEYDAWMAEQQAIVMSNGTEEQS